ncbi:MAG: potassium transporter TrkH, partial [Alphaproteobacteria bacterium]|nr:potassium transporter TrkH [Alphaproteobacteria bacterium]
MLDFRPVFLVVGILLTTLAVGMIIPAAADAVAGHPEWQVFAASAGLTMFVGVAMALASRAGGASFTVRQASVRTTLSWIAITVFSALPCAFSELDLSFTD